MPVSSRFEDIDSTMANMQKIMYGEIQQVWIDNILFKDQLNKISYFNCENVRDIASPQFWNLEYGQKTFFLYNSNYMQRVKAIIFLKCFKCILENYIGTLAKYYHFLYGQDTVNEKHTANNI